ncbi:hypothetical protein JCM9140_1917 [Halalkalibacter wakoensis JCM 9140]|uniref:DUF4097 domain-containing protein n=1 Tax=Halalkalibacter wakoensis JCM 9140 TaxID=1236970 RepID=W4Q1D8_9BACI|nr:DUF4097 family beta strand repeat-containing protein [Halalkalibacter wakoensis]GAE25896.1 hypothetical protein JCM9140_1917 [Halalkalibacter wakoensis JCM 9140]
MRILLGVILIGVGLFLLFVTVSPITSLKAVKIGETLTTEVVPYDSLVFSSKSVDWEFESGDYESMSIELVHHRKNVKIRSKERNGTLEIEVDEPRFHFFRFGHRTKALVTLPNTYSGDIDIGSVSGSIGLKGQYTLGDVNVKSVSGDIFSDTVTSESIMVKTTSGDIDYKKLVASEKIMLESVSGDIVADSVIGPVDGKTVSGDIDLRFDEENKRIQLNTVSGDVDIHVRNGNADLDLQTVSGDIHMGHLPQARLKAKKFTGLLGEGQYPLIIKTTSGDIRIHER